MKVALFALTGIGNSVMRSLVSIGVDVAVLVTRKEKGVYPYYEEVDLFDEAVSLGLPATFDLPSGAWLKENNIDLLLTATFHKIIPLELIQSVRYALNLHPSLLPAYRGPSPFYWVIRNGEKKTGLTLHQLVPDVDAGDIVAQIEIPVSDKETQGSLRKKVAMAAQEFVIENLKALESGTISWVPQDSKLSSSHPRFSEMKDRELDIKMGREQVERHLRALSPWPGASFEGTTVQSIADLEWAFQDEQ